jgi:surface antigen
MAMELSPRPWGDIADADYADAGDYCDASLVNLNEGPRARWSKGACHLPVREPKAQGGLVNRNALGAAAAALVGARGGVTLTPDQKRQAARALVRLYVQADLTPPDALARMSLDA